MKSGEFEIYVHKFGNFRGGLLSGVQKLSDPEPHWIQQYILRFFLQFDSTFLSRFPLCPMLPLAIKAFYWCTENLLLYHKSFMQRRLSEML